MPEKFVFAELSQMIDYISNHAMTGGRRGLDDNTTEAQQVLMW